VGDVGGNLSSGHGVLLDNQSLGSFLTRDLSLGRPEGDSCS